MIPTPYLIGGAAVVFALAIGGAWLHGRDSGLQQYYGYRAKVEAQQDELRAEAERQRLVSEGIVADVSKRWSAVLAHRERNPRIVRVSAACDPAGLRHSGTASPGLAATAGESGLYPGRDEAGTISVEQCETIANQGIVAGAQALHLIDFVIRQHEASQK